MASPPPPRLNSAISCSRSQRAVPMLRSPRRSRNSSRRIRSPRPFSCQKSLRRSASARCPISASTPSSSPTPKAMSLMCATSFSPRVAQYLTKDKLAAAGPNYLIEEIKKRVSNGPVKFKYIAQIAEQGDKLDDPSIAWPDDRKTVELGVIEIDKAVADSDAAQRALLFIENAVPPGIEPEDPMINIRSQAYAISFARRHASAAQ